MFGSDIAFKIDRSNDIACRMRVRAAGGKLAMAAEQRRLKACAAPVRRGAELMQIAATAEMLGANLGQLSPPNFGVVFALRGKSNGLCRPEPCHGFCLRGDAGNPELQHRCTQAHTAHAKGASRSNDITPETQNPKRGADGRNDFRSV